jgi:co-chaperonin GroES (HSP10)
MKPLNRMLLVDTTSEEEKDKPAFYLPDDMVTNKKEHEVVIVSLVAEDSKFHSTLTAGDRIVVEGHMLVEAKVNNKSYHLVLENHVLARC